MNDVTQILSAIEGGDPQAAEKLLPLVYQELRKLAAAKMAQENPGQTLQATALVHDAYIRLVDVDKAQHWDSRGHFFVAAAEAMRRILINRARDKGRMKRGGQLQRIDLDKIEIAIETPDDDILALNEAVERLAEENQESAECGEDAVLRWPVRRRGGDRIGNRQKHGGSLLGLCPSMALRRTPIRRLSYLPVDSSKNLAEV